ncbi:hypothetical protein NEF87_003671 [Candidatus Lokiarchaeum ossiferum]|uniref:CYTH domain-containing protein n=1 Tax=Candidatus Lokiarchaeum ossiferum TaxID=2951803 RepID=A0ABY6HXU2_9ARCH|nr:hypothetical protein NEF87_003671 [Candidatus Lokiarchaeum sp. B-35]
MFEMEIKLKITNIEELRSKLSSLDHSHPVDLHHTDRYYNLPPTIGDFAKTDEALRLRSSIEKHPVSHEIIKECHDLTYKGPKLDKTVKSRIEHVCHVVEAHQMDEILLALGYQKVISVKKQREVHEIIFDGHPIECLIDQIEHLDGLYFEAEMMVGSEEEMSATKQILLNFVNYLGYTEQDTIVESYLELVLSKLT